MPRTKRKKVLGRKALLRSRLPAAQARDEILEVAARRLREVGPDGIRLQEIAREVGVSHPAILHHFGSRQELVRAVVDRAVGRLEQDVIDTLRAGADAEQVDPVAMLARIRTLMEKRGHARLIAWLVLAGYESPARASKIREIGRAVHAVRELRFAGRGERVPPFEDSLFVVLLASVAMLGDALCGAALRESAGLARESGGALFHEWMARLFIDHLSSPFHAAEPA